MSQGRDFWSRRRAGVEAEAKAEAAQAAEVEIAKLEERSDEELLAEAKLPDPDLLESPEAVQEFLKAELPQRLKTRALRRLWRLNPVLANLDGLVDYGEDYTDAATVVENMQTVYQVGKGMLTAFATDDEDDGEEVVAEDPEAPVENDVQPEAEVVVLAEAETVPEMPAEPIVAAAPQPEPEDEMIAAPPRRMRFAFTS